LGRQPAELYFESLEGSPQPVPGFTQMNFDWLGQVRRERCFDPIESCD
jgi:hypothetical protein